MNAAWRRLLEEIGRAREGGKVVEFWWRDDDAARPDPALARLLAMAGNYQVPLALAAIPALAEAQAFSDLPALVSVLQHGSDHRNRAGSGAKKTEFPATDAAGEAIERLKAGRLRLAQFAGARFLPVLAPPWNRIGASYLPHLATAGYRGLSRYGARASAQPVPGLLQVNTHVDLIAWRGDRGFAGEEAVLGAAVAHLAAKRAGKADAGEPTGWLTHHAQHDEPSWRFLERLFETLGASPGVRWLGAEALFHIARP
jgi:hypothetical protein